MASPPLVVAYALAGRVDIDFEKEPLGKDKSSNDVFLRDIWPDRPEITGVSGKVITPQMFKDIYANILKGS